MAKTTTPKPIYQLKIALPNIKPPIWRRIHIKDCSLADLHDVIQECMGWTHSHMHAFEVGGEQYGDPNPDLEQIDDRKLKLSQIADRGLKKFRYTYDFGDNWVHSIQIEKTVEPEPGAVFPVCVAGKRACPPEDCGGPWGYDSFLDTIQNPKNPEHKEMLEWVGGAFDPEEFDIDEINRRLTGHG